MSGAIRVLLPSTAVHLVELVLDAGCTPVIDATIGEVPEVPTGAWVRIRPGRPAPGRGPVVLAEFGAPIPDRPTWLETGTPRDVPAGFAGLILKGREAGGACGDEDGLVALTRCADPGRVILDAGLGPATVASAAALGAAGAWIAEGHLACPELNLPAGLLRRLDLPDAELTRIVGGVRVCASPTAPVLRRLTDGGDPFALAEGIGTDGDPNRHLWMAGQGLALARDLVERHGTLSALLGAYRSGWDGFASAIRSAHVHPRTDLRTVGTSARLAGAATVAGTGGAVGSGVLWQVAAWIGRPVEGPLAAAAAVGGPVVAEADALAALQATVPAPASAAPSPVDAPPAIDAPVGTVGTETPAIAIIGIGCRFPGGSNSVDAFWNNIVGGASAIREVPHERWDPALYWDADRSAPDKSYAKIGGFLEGFRFDSKRFRIPPNVARQVDPVQQITLECVADALADAGLKVDRRSEGREFDRERTSVILGNSLGGEVSDDYAIRLAWPDVARRLVAVPPFCDLSEAERLTFLRDMELAYKAGLPIVDEDSMPGELANVIAGRITNAFDLGGANFTVDAACASSMAAIQTAAKALADGDADLVVTGGADRSMNIATYVKFSKIGALSPDRSSPFDEGANGFVMGEGCGILVLKRYEEAVADGDRIYAVIRGVGASSDGKGKGITAPNIQGQIRALQRAYADAGMDPWEIDLAEAHGTSTVVGDQVEIEALNAVIGSGRRGDRGPIRIGSVKSMIGHLKAAAGAASVIKTALALHYGILPPSLNFRKARAGVPFDVVPLQVQGEAEAWPETPSGIRRAGVSAFGFGGTNFHLVLESYSGRSLPTSKRTAPSTASHAPPTPTRIEAGAPRPVPVVHGLPEGIWAASGLDGAEVLANLKTLAEGGSPAFHPSAPLRLASAPRDAEERASQLERAIRSLEKGSNPDLLRARSIHFEDGPFDGKFALLFTGQGSQYLDMGLDLAETFPMVAETFSEADRVLAPTLGHGITEMIRLTPGEDADAKSDLLRQTEYSQPATLTLDVAILRLLAAYGVLPDLVAGHSLGEYGAAVAAGVMTFEQALLAVSARGREMASIRLDDPGKMAGIATSATAVEAVLAEVDGYVIPANKNCPTQTVIAGASDAVDEACERFRARGVTVYPLPVSHAFHSAIVAPASEPLRGVLSKLGLKAPHRPITTNVTGEYYPTGEGAVPQIIDLLARQISGPVEWTSQMERMYGDGARVFVECGPKRALSGFTVSILKRRPHRALYTNHPKRGGVTSFRDALAGLLALGLPVRSTPEATADLFATPDPRRATTQAILAFTELHRTRTRASGDLELGIVRIVAKTSGYDEAELDLDYELEADLGIDTVKQAEVFSVVRSTYGIPADPDFSFAKHRTLRSLIDWAGERTGAKRITVSTPSVPTPRPPPRGPVVAPPPRVAPIVEADVVAQFLTQAADTGLDATDPRGFAEALLPAVQSLIAAAFAAAQASTPPAPAAVPTVVPVAAPAAAPIAAPIAVRVAGQGWDADPTRRIVCCGASIGLPGGEEVFGSDNFARILSGEGRIRALDPARSAKFLELGLTRLVKDPQTGQGSFLDVTSPDEVIRLAGTESAFALTDWGIDPHLIDALDVTTQLGFAAGLEALRDAGIPLVRTWKTTSTGKRVPRGWGLPEALRDETGVIFGSAFPGYDQLVRHLEARQRDPNHRFDRRFLFQVLAMGHSQFAQLIGARGPNTAINAACASSTQALALAEDWIRLGRCKRVVVVGADDVTSDALLPLIGGGFMAAGAASTHDVVEEAALPFDRRRHGLILGMGAVALVVEDAATAEARGIAPVAEQLGSTIVNSAFHGTRLDVQHIASTLKVLVDDVCAQEGITPADLARQAFFMSHETYTPARGGSAAAEIEALRATFGVAAQEIVVSNTKGFTGHPMGAGIEDGVVVKALQYGFVPPVANLREPDEQLGDLTLSKGEAGPFKYAVRLAAGFGSQLALTVYKAAARGDDRVVDPARRLGWLKEITGFPHVAEVIEDRTLRAISAEADRPYDLRPEVSPADFLDLSPAAGAPAAPVSAPRADAADVLTDLVAVIAERTGYEPEEIEPDFELEADLGIDTVKQAEILGELTDRYGIERDEAFSLADYPTIEALAGYLTTASGGSEATSPTVAPPAAPPTTAAPPASAPPATAPPMPPSPAAPRRAVALSSGGALDDLLEVISEKTGYDREELEVDFELEADLGIDTVKQAEILGDLTERYGLERDEAFRLSDYPTLEKLAGYLDARRGDDTTPPTPVAPSAPAIALAPAIAPPDGSTASGADAEETLTVLIAVVADKTGYDIEDLDPTFELEADLGVDTVKQAEILSALQEQLGVDPDEAFRPADHPTLQDLAAYLAARSGGTSPPAVPEVVAAVAVATTVADGVVVHTPLPPSFRLRRPVLVDAPALQGTGSLAGRAVEVLGSGSDAKAVRAHLAALGADVDATGPSEIVFDVGVDPIAAFHRAQALDETRPQRWVTVTRLGGMSEGADLDRALVDGARAGLTKSLGREWDEVSAVVVDVAPDLPEDAFTTAVSGEAMEDGPLEVFVGADGVRRRVSLQTEAVPPPLGRLSGTPVVLCTGGGRGITARIAAEIASRGPVCLALVGRSPVPTDPLDEAAEKARIKARLKADGDRVTPARVDAELWPLRKGEEVRQTLETLEGLGAQVAYVQADLSIPEDVDRLVAEVTDRLGPPDLVIHGAGVEESRRLADKDDVAFHRVFDGKALGGRALFHAVGDDAFVVSMGSVAGRFGNPGQVDYAAANDAMARMCHARPRSLHLDWTAWDDVGMAVRGGMRSLLEGRGVDLLPADAGAGLLVDLVAAEVTGELVVAGGLGDFEASSEEEVPSDHPLLDRVVVDGPRATGTRVFSRARDPWMVDHAIEGTPVLPGVVGFELMAAVASTLMEGSAPSGATDVRFEAPCKVHHDRDTTVIVEAESLGDGRVSARLISERTLRTGRVSAVSHFEATILFGDPQTAIVPLPAAFLPDEVVSRDGIYQRFFHGPAFQVLTGVFGVSADGLVSEGVALGLLGGLVTDPLVFEAAFQAAGLHRMIVSHQMGLPQAVAEVQLLDRIAPDAEISVLARLRDGVYDVDVDGLDGPVLRVRGFSMIDRGPVPPPDRFETPEAGRPSCFPVSSGSPQGAAGGSVVAEAHADEDPAPWLSAAELGQLRARGTPRRVRDRIAGRIAAKRALSRLTGVPPSGIRIDRAPTGEPLAHVPGHPDVAVSLSHRAGRAIAIAVPAGHVGIDLERVEARPSSFGRTWFDPQELRVIGGVHLRQTVAWAVKEAVLKLIGTGMGCSPHQVKVRAIGPCTAEIQAVGEVRDRLMARGGEVVHIRWDTAGTDEVVVTVRTDPCPNAFPGRR